MLLFRAWCFKKSDVKLEFSLSNPQCCSLTDIDVIRITLKTLNVCSGSIGDPVCGVCEFCCCLQTKIHRSHSHGVHHNFASGSAVHTQTQQEASIILLASYRRWHLIKYHLVFRTNLPFHKVDFFSFCQDVFNSLFAAVFFLVLSLIAIITYNLTGTLVGGVRNTYLIFNGHQCCVVGVYVSFLTL